MLASQALVDITTAVRIEENGYDVSLTIDDSLPAITEGAKFVGSDGTSTLMDPNATTTWNLSGAGASAITSGVNAVTFEGVENLRGGTDADAFQPSSTLIMDETIDGGDGEDAFTGAILRQMTRMRQRRHESLARRTEAHIQES